MTIDQIIALAASIAAFLSALAAFFTICQVSKQRESSYHPELAVARTKFQCISNPLSKGNIPDTWIECTDGEEIQNVLSFFSVPLHNVGLGAARNLKVKWSFQIEDAISKVNELAQKSLTPVFYEYKNGILTLKSDDMGEAISLWINQKEISIDFVLPASINKSSTELIVPPAFIMTVSALVHFYSKTGSFPSSEAIPNLIAEVDYFDIGGKKHKAKVSVTIQITTIIGKGESFMGYIEANNRPVAKVWRIPKKSVM